MDSLPYKNAYHENYHEMIYNSYNHFDLLIYYFHKNMGNEHQLQEKFQNLFLNIFLHLEYFPINKIHFQQFLDDFQSQQQLKIY